MDYLKEEAENGFVEVSKLHTSIFTDQVNQLFGNINVIIDNLSTQIQDEKFQENAKSILAKNSYIRSINILDDKYNITNSTNSTNINKVIDISDYYPQPMFNDFILRFGKTQKKRDLFEEDKTLSYIPVIKKVLLDSKSYTVLITINNDYFTNRYLEYLSNYKEELSIIRLDNTLLYTSSTSTSLGTIINSSKIYKESVEKSLASGIELIGGDNYIVTYQLTDTYPLVVAVKLDYDYNLKEWEYKTLIALLLIGIIVFGIAYVIIKLISKNNKSRNKELEYQKQQLINQEKIRNAYIVYNNTNDGIVITDESCNIIDINKAFTRNTGYILDEIYGLNPKVLKSNMYSEEFYKNMWEHIVEENYWHGEIVNKNKSGKLYTELLTINKVFDKESNIKNYIGVFTNITKQKEQEKLLEEKEQFILHQSKMASMGEMLENIAHQWRQPLSVISTAATGSLVESELGLASEEKNNERFTLINDSAQHLSKTIDDFRNFFKPDKDKISFSLEHVINESLKILSSKFKNRNIEVIKNTKDIEINGYERELIQVIMNILNNARDVLENQNNAIKLIFIDISSEHDTAIIKIKDSGGGIPTDIIDKIFEPYFTTKHQAQGTGIGLYMSEEIITKHFNGTIKVKNTSYTYNNIDLKGAEFIVTLNI